jgi:hypothetical protein
MLVRIHISNKFGSESGLGGGGNDCFNVLIGKNFAFFSWQNRKNDIRTFLSMWIWQFFLNNPNLGTLMNADPEPQTLLLATNLNIPIQTWADGGGGSGSGAR